MSMTTRPQQMPGTTRAQLATVTTSRQTTPGSLAQPETNTRCASDINIPDYSVLRQQKLEKINTYYNKLLSSYTQSLKEYNTNLASSNVNDRTYANTTLQPKVKNNNTQIINLSKEMIKNVDLDTELIIKQKDELATKTRNIDTLLNNIKLLKEKDSEMAILTKARNDSINSTASGVDSMNFSTYIYIGINMFLVLLIIGIVIYIVYSNYNSSSINNARSSNSYINSSVPSA